MFFFPISQTKLDTGRLIRSRNYLPFTRPYVYNQFFGGGCVGLFCLRSVSCVQCCSLNINQSMLLASLDFPFLIALYKLTYTVVNLLCTLVVQTQNIWLVHGFLSHIREYLKYICTIFQQLIFH